MNIIKINPDHPEPQLLKTAGESLKDAAVIAHATETVYGLAAVWNSWPAIQAISKIKNRPLLQPYSIMVASVSDIVEIAGWETPLMRKFLETIFPAPITILIARKRTFDLPYWNEFREIGFRLPDHTISKMLVQHAKSPLITTSANISGEVPPVTCSEISETILMKVACVLDSGSCQLQTPSTVVKVDFDRKKYEILREGAMASERFNQLFKSVFQ